MIPYNFTPLGVDAPRTPITKHEKFAGHSGILACQLKTLTHFFIAGRQERVARNQHQQLSLLREDDAPIIPGSSLKGAIRNLAEAISGSCLTLPNDRRVRNHRQDKLEYYDYKKRSSDFYYPLKGFAPCGLDEGHRDEQVACPACRLFGFLFGEFLFAGNVSFETAKVVGPYETKIMILEPFGAPAPRHRPFYGTKASDFREPRGRKFYYHRVEGARIMDKRLDSNKTIEAIMPGAIFEFTVHYQNLSSEELALLIYALVLEEPMRPKMGMGKGVGLGSVQIGITRWQQIEIKNRYLQLGSGTIQLSNEDLQKAIKNQIEAYHRHYSDWKDSLTILKDILTWDVAHPRDPRYPSKPWFEKNGNVALEDVPEDAAEFGRRSTPGGPAPRQHFAPRPADAEKRTLEQSKEAQALLKKIEKEQKTKPVSGQSAYANRDVEKKATVVAGHADSLNVELPKLPEQKFALKVKPQFSNAAVGNKIRVRVVVDKNGNITYVEEI